MQRMNISVPDSLDLVSALDFSTMLSAIEESEGYTFDFSRTRIVEPFPMLLVSSQIRDLSGRFPKSTVGCANYKHMTYAGHMGFFQAFGLDYGKFPGEAKGSNHYLPLTIYDCESLIKSAAEKGTEVGDEVEEVSKQLAKILCNQEGPVYDTLAYSLRELMRNVVEHSHAKQFGICAQHWPSKHKVEVAILDRGIGLQASLRHNPHLDVSDDKRAINYALMPAVSGKAFKGSRKQRGNWANSGFGLYMTSRICRNGGTFFIASGKTGMLITHKSEGKRYFPCNFRGTAVRMVVRTDQIAELKDALAKYREEGYAIQSKYKEIVNIDPSAASLMLSEDFDLSVWDKILLKLKGKKSS